MVLVICAYSFVPPAVPIIQIPLATYQLCVFKQHVPLEMGYTTLALFYGTMNPYSFCPAGEGVADCLIDLLAFLFIIYLAFKSGAFQSGLPSLFGVMAEDATLYFMVIFTSHLILELTLIFGSVRTSSHRSVSFSFAETFVAFDKTAPWNVSNNMT